MIKMDISTAIFLYLSISVIGILIVWSFFDFGTKLKTYSSDEKHIWHCSICSITYIDSMHDDISECPRCGSYNQRMAESRMSTEQEKGSVSRRR